MAWTTPRTWVTSEVVTSSVMNTHIRDQLLALSTGRVSTTMAAAVAAVGAVDGLSVSLRINSASGIQYQDLVEMTYNAAIGKWYSVQQTIPIQRDTAFSATGIASGTITALNNHSSGLTPMLLYRPYNTAGLKANLRVIAVAGLEFTGSQTAAELHAAWYSADVGAAGADANIANLVGSGGYQTSIATSATGTTGSIADTGWGATQPTLKDMLTPTAYFYGTGTGTYSYYLKHATAHFRWEY